jgi:hypothetical protein
MTSLVSLFSLYIIAIIVGRNYTQYKFQSGVLLTMLAFVQVIIVLIVMFVMDPPSMVRGGH